MAALSPPASYVFNLGTPLTALSAAGVAMTEDEREVYAEWKMVWEDVRAEKLGNVIRGKCDNDDDESELTKQEFLTSISTDAFAISLVQDRITTSTSFKFSDALLNSLLINPEYVSQPTAEDSTTPIIPTKRPRRILPPQRPVPRYPPPPVPTTHDTIDTVSAPIAHDAPITEADLHIPPVAALLRQHDYRSIQVRRVRKAKRVTECENIRLDTVETARGEVNEPAIEIFDASVDTYKGQVNEPKVAKTSKTARRFKSLHNLKRLLPI